MTDHALITWLSCTDPLAGHILYVAGTRELMMEYGNDFVNKGILSFLVIPFASTQRKLSEPESVQALINYA